MDNEITLHSGVTTATTRLALQRGIALGGLGAVILLGAGAFMPVDLLRIWGFPLFFISMALITAGLLPYRRLRSLENRPYCLKISEQSIRVFSEGKFLMNIPQHSIERLAFVQESLLYGVAIWLKHSEREKVEVAPGGRRMIAKMKRGVKEGGDLFLPYFTERSFHAILSLR